jgi:predicted Zn-dependent peptidase
MRQRSIAHAPAILITLVAATTSIAQHADPPTETRLPNGLRVRFIPDPNSTETLVLLAVPAGILDEPTAKPHVAHLAEHMLVFAAEPNSEHARALDHWFPEGRANAETLGHFMYFDLRIPPKNLRQALEIQAERLNQPSLSTQTLNREKPRALAEIDHLTQSKTGTLAKFALSAWLQAAAYQSPSITLRADTNNLAIEDIHAFWHQNATTHGAVVSIIGNFDPSAQTLAAEILGAIPAKKPQSNPPPIHPASIDATWDVNSHHVLLGWALDQPSTADHAALWLAAQILAAKLSRDPTLNRLAKTPFLSAGHPHFLILDLEAKPNANLDQIERLAREHLHQLANNPAIPAPEFRIALSVTKSRLDPLQLDLLALPKNVTRIMALGNHELMLIGPSLRSPYPESLPTALRDLNPDAFQKTIAHQLSPDRASVVRLTPKP